MPMDVPRFEPHPLWRGGDLQTIAGFLLPSRRVRLRSKARRIRLDDGDQLVVDDSVPPDWSKGDPLVVLIHGLGGSSEAPYIVRVADRLVRWGIRACRMNLRGAGAGFGLAKEFYHGGRTEDVRAVLDWAAKQAKGSPIAMVGFSLGGNLALKLAAEAAEEPVPGLDCVLAANPPIDLALACETIQRGRNRIYDRNFVRELRRQVRRLHKNFPELTPVDLKGARTLLDFDEIYTSRRNGFNGAGDYYTRCGSALLIPRIRLPGLVVHAEDDPFIPAHVFRETPFPDNLALELIPTGGHLGYLSRTPWEGDRRWLDTRLVAWLVGHWRARSNFRGRPDVEPLTSSPKKL